MINNEALRLLRVFNDMKAADLAKALGISAAYLSEIETGKKKPSTDIIEKYASVFKTKPSALLFFSESMTKNNLKRKIANNMINFLHYIENINVKN